MESFFEKLDFAIRGGKHSKFLYFAGAYARKLVPAAFYRARRDRLLRSIAGRPDAAEIEARAAYYCKLAPGVVAGPGTPDSEVVFPFRGYTYSQEHLGRTRTVGENSPPRRALAYYLDARESLRYFPPEFRYRLICGDAFWVPASPTLTKARPIAEGAANANAVLLCLNKIRHFLFVRDTVPFSSKMAQAVFRGKVTEKPKREALFRKFFGNPRFDLGDTDRRPEVAEWITPRMPIPDQLKYRYILSIEGNDVASNLKWILSSNSVAVMPKPEFETWFQEGLLRPGVHYIEIAPDYSDLEEKLAWYDGHVEEAEKIVAAGHAWVRRFADAHRERLVSLRVLERYFTATGQSR